MYKWRLYKSKTFIILDIGSIFKWFMTEPNIKANLSDDHNVNNGATKKTKLFKWNIYIYTHTYI